MIMIYSRNLKFEYLSTQKIKLIFTSSFSDYLSFSMVTNKYIYDHCNIYIIVLNVTDNVIYSILPSQAQKGVNLKFFSEVN